jgi:hypothetical protein
MASRLLSRERKMYAHIATLGWGTAMKKMIASLLGHLFAMFIIVSFSATPADTWTICKGPSDTAPWSQGEQDAP